MVLSCWNILGLTLTVTGSSSHFGDNLHCLGFLRISGRSFQYFKVLWLMFEYLWNRFGGSIDFLWVKVICLRLFMMNNNQMRINLYWMGFMFYSKSGSKRMLNVGTICFTRWCWMMLFSQDSLLIVELPNNNKKEITKLLVNSPTDNINAFKV